MDSGPQNSFEVIPAVDVLGGRVVRLRRGDYAAVTEYGDDPLEAATAWIEQGASRVHVVDLEGARTGAFNLALWERLGAAGLPFQAGGGIRTAEAAARLLAAGADRVVMGTAAVWNPESLAGLGESVVAAVDVRGGKATGSGWLDEGRAIADVLDGLADVGVARLLVTGIARDGMLTGPDVALTSSVMDDGRFGVLASGGVAELTDLDPLVEMGCEGVVVGRALYSGRLELAAAMARVGTLQGLG